MLMWRIAGWCIAVIVGIVMVINAGFMVASPRTWFHLPAWLRTQGSLTEDRYSGGWGALQIRLTGGAILATIAWVLYDMFFSR
jgi:hypothetical protein